MTLHTWKGLKGSVLVLALLLTGCSSDPSPTTASSTPPSTKAMGLTTRGLLPSSYVTVESIADARTVVLSDGNQFRLIGLAAPAECWAAAAVEFAKSMLVGKLVRYTRLSDGLATLHLTDDSDYSLLAVSRGVLRAESTEVDLMREAQESAERADLGLWGPPCDGRETTSAPSPSPAPPAPPPATSARASAPQPNGCAVTYRVVKRWQNGFEGSVEVRNSNTTPINGWTLKWTFSNGERLDHIWNAEATQNGAQIDARNASYNSSIAAGDSVSIGYTVRSDRGSGSPRSFSLNGTACTTT
ncbi:cellulose binding domain-containing protein [Streptomyces sp. ID05-26A]|nr:cellulose binding domain-containing protein [Streptomyces sp. ID05-26A]